VVGKPFNYLLLKLAMRCNIDCTYCYWFRDKSVYRKPKILRRDVEDALVRKLEEHINTFCLKDFDILFHGGEPLLFGKRRFAALCEKLANLDRRTGCRTHLSMTTNGILIDQQWAELLSKFAVDVTVSVDGPPEIHDKNRITFQGAGTSTQVLNGVKILQENEIFPGVLAVCNPSTDPKSVISYFVNTLGLGKFDILTPDSTHEDNPESIARYFIDLFDVWYHKYAQNGVDIRYLRSMVKGLLGGVSKVESIGYGPINTVCMLTDGSLEPLDVIRITGSGATQTDLNIFENTFEDMKSNPLWNEAYHASMKPCKICLECPYVQACGGGFLPHRFSKERGYDNPSVYCDDLKLIFDHIWQTISPEVTISSKANSKTIILDQILPA